MNYQERVSVIADVRALYKKVKADPRIAHYRGYTASKSYGWDEEADGIIKRDGEEWFENPSYDPDWRLKQESKGNWRETLKRLIETPPVMGIEVIQSPIETHIKELVGSYTAYLRQQIQVHCDPDVLEQTAQKNKELMEEIDKIYEAMKSGELIVARRAHWTEGDDGWFTHYTCSECGRRELKREPYCNCGCKMDWEET